MLLSDCVKEDILLYCRYGDLEEVEAFVKEYGKSSLVEIRDDNGNSILHLICANGHIELLNYLLPLVPPHLLAAQNDSGSTPLHWAALNAQLEVAQKLVLHPDGPGRDLIDIKNNIGRSPFGEAEFAGWNEGAKWFVEMMNLDTKEKPIEDEVLENSSDVEVEIQDADGQVARMTLSGSDETHTHHP